MIPPLLDSRIRSGSIAVIRALQLGDMLCAVPALRSLRNSAPDARITLIGLPWAAEFVSRYSHYLNQLLEFPGYPGIPEAKYHEERYFEFLRDVRRQPFDLVIQLHGSGDGINTFAADLQARRTAGFWPSAHDCPNDGTFLLYPDNIPEIRRHLALMRFLGGASVSDEIDFPILAADREAVADITAPLSASEYVCVHVGSRWPSRRWQTAGYAAVADAIVERGLRVVFTGSPCEADIVEPLIDRMRHPSLNLVGRTSLGAMACLIQGAKLLISNDTGAAHIAAAVRTPSVVIVLGSDFARWRPLDHERHSVVRFPVWCAPCEYFECPTNHECSIGLSVKAVLQAALRQLDRYGNRRSLLRQSVIAGCAAPSESTGYPGFESTSSRQGVTACADSAS